MIAFVAQIQLALMLTTKALDGWGEWGPAEADLRRADDLISKVLAVDPHNSYAHFVKGTILLAQGQILGMQDRLAQSIGEYETAIALDPNSPIALRDLALAKILIGEPAEAIPLLERSLRINPRDPIVGFIYHRLGLAHQLLGHIDEAIQWHKKSIALYPFPDRAYATLGAALSLKGDREAARAALAEAARRNPKLTTIVNIKRRLEQSQDPKYLALREQTIIKGLRKAGVPEE